MLEEGLGLHSRSWRTLPEGTHCRSHCFGIQAWKSFQASALSEANFPL